MELIEFLTPDEKTLKLIAGSYPYPANQKIPQWFLDTPKFIPDAPKVDRMGDPLTTIRSCVPFMDLMTAGYHIPLPCDVWVHREGDTTSVRWSQDELTLVIPHDPIRNKLMPTSEAYEHILFKIANPWIIRTPKNYSSIVQHPYGHDLPFESIASIVDTDKFPIPINIPIRFKKNFQGLIPKGTPFIQVIPFKREEWKSNMSYDDGQLESIWYKAHSYFFDRYRRFFRAKKTFKCPFHV
jgi:hypothetical protein